MGSTVGNIVNLTAFRGTLGLALAIRMGRFFYTPVLPLMVAALPLELGASCTVTARKIMRIGR